MTSFTALIQLDTQESIYGFDEDSMGLRRSRVPAAIYSQPIATGGADRSYGSNEVA